MLSAMVNRRSIILTTIFGLTVVSVAASHSRGEEARRPNVILILADDLGYGDVGCFQELYEAADQRDAKTPHIDSLARNGVRLTDFYAHPVCTPSRYCLLTGWHLGRSSDLRDVNVLDYDYPEQGLRAHEETIAEVFQANGYATAAVGKWHLGSGQMSVPLPPTPPFSRENLHHPNAHGFDYFYGFLGGSIDYNTHNKRDLFFDWFENRNLLFEDDGHGNNIHADHNRYATHLVAEKAVELIDQYAGSRQPFFLYLPLVAPHWAQTAEQTSLAVHQLPLEETDSTSPYFRRYLKYFDNRYPAGDETNWRKRLLAMVRALDEGIGQLMERLRMHGLEEHTIIFFTSDNGGETCYSKNEILYGSDNGPFTRGDKATMYEGGIRVPTVVQWKGQLPAGRTSRQIGSVVDVKLTLARLAGLDMDACRTDGFDLGPNIRNPQQVVERDHFCHSGFYGSVYRRGDWKFVRHHRGASKDQDELYNLARDAGETTNLACENVDILRELKELHAAKLAEVLKGGL